MPKSFKKSISSVLAFNWTCFAGRSFGRVAGVLLAYLILFQGINWESVSLNHAIASTSDDHLSTFVYDLTIQKESPFVLAADDEKDGTFFNERSRSWLTPDQLSILNLAYSIGQKDNQGELLQSIVMQESHAGALQLVGHKSQAVGKRSYGIAQIKVSAATDVLKRHPDLGFFNSDEELISKLLADNTFNLTVASKFLLILKQNSKSEAQAIVAYNLGLHGSLHVRNHQEYRYAKGVYANLYQVVRPFNKKSTLAASSSAIITSSL